MIVQDVTALPNFNPHCGPITHSSRGSKPDSPVHPLFPRLSLAHGLVCNSWASFRGIINSGIRHNTYSHCYEPLSHPVSGTERLPACSKLLMIPPYFALDIFLSFNSRVTLPHLPRCYRPDGQPCKGLFSQNNHISSFVSTMEFSKKGCRLHHDLKQRNEDINVVDRSLKEEQPRPRGFIRIS